MADEKPKVSLSAVLSKFTAYFAGCGVWNLKEKHYNSALSILAVWKVAYWNSTNSYTYFDRPEGMGARIRAHGSLFFSCLFAHCEPADIILSGWSMGLCPAACKYKSIFFSHQQGRDSITAAFVSNTVFVFKLYNIYSGRVYYYMVVRSCQTHFLSHSVITQFNIQQKTTWSINTLKWITVPLSLI